jgi:hypothetical protein
MQCTVGIGLTAGVVGVMMTIICCKTLCEFLLELSQPDPTQRPPLPIVAPTILEMPIIRKRMEKLFPSQDEFYDSQSSLLNTIRVPKNLLYLTDRLPKPSYESP